MEDGGELNIFVGAFLMVRFGFAILPARGVKTPPSSKSQKEASGESPKLVLLGFWSPSLLLL